MEGLVLELDLEAIAAEVDAAPARNDAELEVRALDWEEFWDEFDRFVEERPYLSE